MLAFIGKHTVISRKAKFIFLKEYISQIRIKSVKFDNFIFL